MLNFRKITPEDRALLHPYFSGAGLRGCEDSFSCVYLWGEQEVTVCDDVPLILRRHYFSHSYAMPLAGDRAALIEALRGDAHEHGHRLRLFAALKEDVDFLQAQFPGQFSFEPMRNSFDYIYEIDRLCELRGKSLQSKRNFCNRFEAAHPNYRVEPLTAAHLPRLAEFAELWYALHASTGEDYGGEQRALSRAFSAFDALGFEGIALLDADTLVGFAVGSRMSETVFDIHFEKALADVPGAYPMVNREFARLLRERHPDLRLINREDDMGIAGLRSAKESYHPDILLEKWLAVEENDI